MATTTKWMCIIMRPSRFRCYNILGVHLVCELQGWTDEHTHTELPITVQPGLEKSKFLDLIPKGGDLTASQQILVWNFMTSIFC